MYSQIYSSVHDPEAGNHRRFYKKCHFILSSDDTRDSGACHIESMFRKSAILSSRSIIDGVTFNSGTRITTKQLTFFFIFITYIYFSTAQNSSDLFGTNSSTWNGSASATRGTLLGNDMELSVL